MSRMSHLTDHALELAEQASAGLRHASQSLRDAGVDAERWIKTGAALGAVKTGSKVAAKAVRRNPAATIAVAAVGVGLLGYALYRKQQKKKLAGGHVVNGQAQRVAARDRRASTIQDEHSDIGSDA